MDNRVRPGNVKRYAIRLDRAAREFPRLPVEVQALLRLCDGTRGVRRLRALSGLRPELFERILGRLLYLGLIGETPTRGPDRRTAVEALAWTRDVGVPLPALAPAPDMVDDVLDEVDPLGLTHRVERADPLALTERFPKITSRVTIGGDFSDDEEAFFAQTIDHLLEPEERIFAPGR